MKKLFLSLVTVASLFFALPAVAQEPTNPIEIEISDIQINGTKLKRKAQLYAMTYNMQLKFLSLSWRVSYYADSAGKYGPLLNINGISYYNKESVANNTVTVNAATGEILKPDESGSFPPGITTMGQYDWFYMMAEEHQLEVHNLIREYGLAAEW